MKKTKLYIALLSLSLSLNAFAMGLGEIKVNSSLDQPFDAEIELIDVGGTSLSGVKANLASVADYQRAGLEQTLGLSSLTFVVERNRHGHPIIKVRSIERISDPFIQLLVDLAWAKGQVYREYSILLDPPDYQLLVTQTSRHRVKRSAARHHLDSEKATGMSSDIESSSQPIVYHVSYGPTVQGETVWQIAQRYKAPGISLPQFILAMVGLNQDAFMDENLNGLKGGVTLRIPSSATAGRVPLLDAKREIMAHDTAWQTKQPIQHILLPPYIEPPASGDQLTLESSLPSVPTLALSGNFIPPTNTYLSAGQDVVPSMRPIVSHPAVVNPVLNAQMDIAAQAIESVRESNALLKEQLHAMQAQNSQLQKQISQRDAQMSVMRSQLELLMRRQGIAGQVIQSKEAGHHHHFWLWFFVLLGVGAGGFYVAWRKGFFPDYFSKPKPNLEVASTEEVAEPVSVVDSNVEPSVQSPVDTTSVVAESVSPEKPLRPVRSKAALDTLLTLAETYIEMGDNAGATESLLEVLEHGNKKQQKAAKQLLDGMENNK